MGDEQMSVHKKMSDIMIELALISFRNPKAIPSSEVAHAALLFAQVAWNRTLGHDTQGYQELLNVFLRANPDLWSELFSRDAEALIEKISQARGATLSRGYSGDRGLRNA
jgi:hypothetical protein